MQWIRRILEQLVGVRKMYPVYDFNRRKVYAYMQATASTVDHEGKEQRGKLNP
jgi:hypothetical protein